MLKPIVSMNQMAMNESIATTCCYAWNAVTASNIYAPSPATVLHGGKLSADWDYDYYYPLGLTINSSDDLDRLVEKGVAVEASGGWLNVPLAPTYAYRSMVSSGSGLPYQSGGEWYSNGTAITQYSGTDIINTDVWQWVDSSSFYTTVRTSAYVKHVGSTSPHFKWTTDHSWLTDHNAAQYSS